MEFYRKSDMILSGKFDPHMLDESIIERGDNCLGSMVDESVNALNHKSAREGEFKKCDPYKVNGTTNSVDSKPKSTISTISDQVSPSKVQAIQISLPCNHISRQSKPETIVTPTSKRQQTLDVTTSGNGSTDPAKFLTVPTHCYPSKSSKLVSLRSNSLAVSTNSIIYPSNSVDLSMDNSLRANSNTKTTPTKRRIRKRTQDQRELRATIRMAIIIAFFCLMWLGFFVVYVIRSWCPEQVCVVPRELEAFFFWLGYANSIVNPILYTVFNDDFRKAFLKLLTCRRKR